MVLKETILTVYQFRFSFFKSSLFILQLKATELNIKVGKKNSLWIELCQKYKDIINNCHCYSMTSACQLSQ